MKKISAFFKKIGYAIEDAFLDAWDYVKEIPWNKPVKPVIAWPIFCATFAIAIALLAIFCF